MLKTIYLAGLSTLLLCALLGLLYCIVLMGKGDPAGLANVGKLLLVLLYTAYRLRSLLNLSFQIYRPWESTRAVNIKRALHSGIVPSLCVVAGACIGIAVGWDAASSVLLFGLTLLLAVFLSIEAVNAIEGTPTTP